MKFLKAITIVPLLVASSLAQGIQIGAPASGASIAAGSNFTVEVDRPDTLSGSREVAIVIGLQSCPTSPCTSPQDSVGSVLYAGPYNPQFLNDGVRPPHQNFSVTAPATMAKGRALLSVTHLALIGAGESDPFLEFENATLNII